MQRIISPEFLSVAGDGLVPAAHARIQTIDANLRGLEVVRPSALNNSAAGAMRAVFAAPAQDIASAVEQPSQPAVEPHSSLNEIARLAAVPAAQTLERHHL